MVKLVAEHGTRFWALIGAKLNGRTGKQVRSEFAVFHFSVSDAFFSVVNAGTINWTLLLIKILGLKMKKPTLCKRMLIWEIDGLKLPRESQVEQIMPSRITGTVQKDVYHARYLQ
jgi:hypothetical protein